MFYLIKETGVSKSDKTNEFGGCNSDLIQVATVSIKTPKFRNVVFSLGDCITVDQVPALPLRFFSLHIVTTHQ